MAHKKFGRRTDKWYTRTHSCMRACTRAHVHTQTHTHTHTHTEGGRLRQGGTHSESFCLFFMFAEKYRIKVKSYITIYKLPNLERERMGGGGEKWRCNLSNTEHSIYHIGYRTNVKIICVIAVKSIKWLMSGRIKSWSCLLQIWAVSTMSQVPKPESTVTWRSRKCNTFLCLTNYNHTVWDN